VWLQTQTFRHVCFLSDSMSMFRKIETGCIRRKWLESIERSNLTAVCFIFVPGHAGVKGNECEDILADIAVEQGDTAMDRTDILKVIRGKL
jgi:ribonuclease HI